MLPLVAISILIGSVQAGAVEAPRQEIRFCPGDVARSYPLDSSGRVRSLLTPHIAVINHAAAPFTVTAVHLELLQGGQVIDARHFGAADIERFATDGPEIGQLLQAMPFMFCGAALIVPGIRLTGATLHRGEGLVVPNQVLAFDRERDTLRVRAEGMAADGPAELTATLPVTSDFAKTGWLFPLRGVSYVGWGASLHTAHRWVLPEAYALDIARIGTSGLTYHGDGTRFSDYYAYGTEIYAATAGMVVETENGAPEDRALLQRPDESTDG